MIGATDIFVSYKAEDRARIQPLLAALGAEGFTTWWDAHIGTGAHWREEIQAHLDAAKCVVVVWSKRSVGPEGEFVRDEATRARKRGAYLPVRIDSVETPLGFGEVQAISLKGWKGDRSDPRFIAVAEAVRRRIAGQAIGHFNVKHRGAVSRRTAITLGAGVGVASLAGVGGWLLLPPPAADHGKIAVLPFANLSGDQDQAYFAEGIAEELRSALSRIGLEVIGRASSDAVKDLDTRTAASKLDVAHVLTGSVRRSPQTIRINAQLIDGKDGVQQWAQTYDRKPGDEIQIQTDIAANVTEALRIALGDSIKAAIALGGTADSIAQDFFLRASALIQKDTGENALRQALKLLDSAIARDPNYAGAFTSKSGVLELLATSYPDNDRQSRQVLAQAEAMARHAIALAPTFAPAYAKLALLSEDRFDLAAAFRFINKALSLSANSRGVLSDAAYITWYAGGDPRKALPLADRVIELDPLSPPAYSPRAGILIDLRRYPEAIETARKSIQLAPKRQWPHQLVGDSLLLMGRTADARSEYSHVDADDVFRLRGEAVMAARAGDSAAFDRIISRMHASFAEAASFQYAQAFAQARQNDRSFAALEKCFDVKDPGVIGARTDPFLDPIRSDPRYGAIVKRLNSGQS